MAKPWSEVANSPEYQALPADQQEQARRQYFEQVVAPQLQPAQYGPAYQQFTAYDQQLGEQHSILHHPINAIESEVKSELAGGHLIVPQHNPVGDAAASIDSALLQFPGMAAGELIALSDALSRHLGTDTGITPQQAASKVTEAISGYHPTTPTGQATQKIVNWPFEKLAQLGDWINARNQDLAKRYPQVAALNPVAQTPWADEVRKAAVQSLPALLVGARGAKPGEAPAPEAAPKPAAPTAPAAAPVPTEPITQAIDATRPAPEPAAEPKAPQAAAVPERPFSVQHDGNTITVTPSAKSPGQWQVTTFDKKGSSLDVQVPTYQDAVKTVESNGADMTQAQYGEHDLQVPEQTKAGPLTQVHTPSGEPVSVAEHVVDASQVTASHDHAGNVNPEYPAELQPRDRNRVGYQDQINRIANDLKPQLLAESHSAAEGSPIVGPDGVVESGNGRVAAIRQAYDTGKAGAYKQMVEDKAKQLGVDTSQMKQPMLVRMRETPMTMDQRAQFARQANEAPVAQMGATERANSDAQQLGDIMHLYDSGETGDMAAASNRDFVRAFIQRMPANERPMMMTDQGHLSIDGANRIRNALFKYAYGDSSLVSRMAESTDPGIKNVLNALTAKAGQFARLDSRIKAGELHDVGIGPDIAAAVNRFADIQRRGGNVDAYIRQAGSDMFGDQKLSPEAEQILRFLGENRRSGKKISDFLQNYADMAETSENPKQGGLMGSQAPDKMAMLEQAAKEAQTGISRRQQAMDFEKAPAFSRNIEEGQTRFPKRDQAEHAADRLDKMGRGRPAIRYDETRHDWELVSPAFKRTMGASPKVFDVNQVKAKVHVLTKSWKNEPEIEVLGSPADAHFDVPADAAGAYLDGKVYVFADNIKDVAHLKQVIAHEIVGHYASRIRLGHEYSAFLESLYDKHGDEIATLANRLGIDTADPVGRLEAADEFVAEAAGRTEPLYRRIVDKAIQAIRKVLKRMGLMLPEDELNQLIRQNRQFVEEGHGNITADTLNKLNTKYADINQVKEQLDQGTTDVAKEVGGDPILAPLKSRRRALEKIDTDYEGDPTQIKDLARSTVAVHSHEAAMAAIESVRKRFKVVGDPRILFGNPDLIEAMDGYRDAKFNVEINGHIAEIQINTKPMLIAKAMVHDLYEAMITLERKVGYQELTGDQAIAHRAMGQAEHAVYDVADQLIHDDHPESQIMAKFEEEMAQLRSDRRVVKVLKSLDNEAADRIVAGDGRLQDHVDQELRALPFEVDSSLNRSSEMGAPSRLTTASGNSAPSGERQSVAETRDTGTPLREAKSSSMDQRVAYSRTAVDRHPSGLRELYTERFGKPLYEKIAHVTVGLLSRVKLADDSPIEFKRMMREYRAEIAKGVHKSANVVQAMKDVPEAERTLLSDYIEGEMQDGTQVPEHIQHIADSMQAAIGLQTDELINLGMLSKETADRWRGRYLPRYYARHTENRINRMLRRRFQRIDGSHFKGRGMYESVHKERVPGMLNLGWEVRDEHVLELANEQQLDMFDQRDVLKVLKDMKPGSKVQVWRDYLPDERRKMGEIRDAMYRYARGYMETSRDIALGRLFKHIAMSDVAQRSYSDGYRQVPDTTIPDTGGVKRFGALSGMYVPEAVFDHLEYQVHERSPIVDAYMHLLSLWKEGKTSLNPVVHSNNIISNIPMADFAGISPLNFKAYHDAFVDYTKKGKYYQEGVEHGLFGTEFYGNEIRQLMPQAADMKDLETAAAGWLRRTADYVAKHSGGRFYREKMGNLYQAEDQYFKLLIYRHNRLKGESIEDSIDQAERYIFNYMDIPKGVRMVKSLPIGLPFFSYTYKAAPALFYTLLTEPWKIAKWAALFGGINWASYQYLFNDPAQEEKEERAVMSPYMKGRTALGVLKSMRLPMNGPDGEAVFLDLSRRMPLGDIFDASNQMGGLPIPQPLVPNNPVFTTLMAMVGNKDSFTGNDVVKDSDSAWEAAKKRAGWMVRQVLPNSPVVPFSYSFDKVMSGLASATGEKITVIPGVDEYTGLDYYGRPWSLPAALADTLAGFKIRTEDVPLQREKRKLEIMSQIRELEAGLRSDMRNQGLSADIKEARRQKFDERMAELRSKLQALNP